MSLSPGDRLDGVANTGNGELNIPKVPEGFNLQPFLEAGDLGSLLTASNFNLVEAPQRTDADVFDLYGAINALQRAVILEDEGKLAPEYGVADYFRERIRITAAKFGIDTTHPDFTYLVN